MTNPWLQFADMVVGALLAVAFLLTGGVLTALGHDVPPEVWGAAVALGSFAAGASRKNA